MDNTSTTRRPRFEVFPDQANEWRFRLVAGNGEIVAQSEGYATPSNARRAVRRLQAIAPSADLRLIPAPQERP